MAIGFGLGKLIKEVKNSIGNKFVPGLKTLIFRKTVNAFRTEAKDRLLIALIAQYDNLVSMIEPAMPSLIRDKDPMVLSNFKNMFAEHIDREIQSARIEDNRIILELGDKEFWGYNKEPEEGTADSLDFLVYYIEGFTGEVGFISKEHYEKMRSKPRGKLGRYGLGFLIHKEDYVKEGWEVRTGISFNDIRHPISGWAGFKGFEEVAGSFNFSPFIADAVKEAVKEATSIKMR